MWYDEQEHENIPGEKLWYGYEIFLHLQAATLFYEKLALQSEEQSKILLKANSLIKWSGSCYFNKCCLGFLYQYHFLNLQVPQDVFLLQQNPQSEVWVIKQEVSALSKYSQIKCENRCLMNGGNIIFLNEEQESNL